MIQKIAGAEKPMLHFHHFHFDDSLVKLRFIKRSSLSKTFVNGMVCPNVPGELS